MKSIWKYSVAALVAILIGCGSASAQFRFGVKAGINLNSLHLSNFGHNFNKENGCGFTGGVMTEFQVPLIGLCFDASLMYTHMSAATDVYTNTDGDLDQLTEITPKKDFLEIPINVKYKLGLPIIHPYVFTGPSFAFKFGGDNDYFKTKTVQCAWNVGLGFELLNHVQISGSYGFGMNNILKKSGIVDNTTEDLKIKNNYWTITAAYLF